MSDKEIIDGLIERDNRVTEQFLYVRCRPLLTAIMKAVFNYPVEYDEMVSELYGFLMENDAAKLRKFEFRSSVFQWLKVVATRFFIRHRNNLIENSSKEPLYEQADTPSRVEIPDSLTDRADIERLLGLMRNKRYADVVRTLVLDDIDPEAYAESIGVTVDNLYNIKKRAIASFARYAQKYYSYGC